MKHAISKTLAGCLTALGIACMSLTGVAADDSSDAPQMDGLSLTIRYTYQDNEDVTAIDGAGFEIVKVAELVENDDGSYSYVLEDEYSSADIDFTGMTTAEAKEAAQTLMEMTDDTNLETKVTDADGYVEFDDLTAGMYLVNEKTTTGTAANYSMLKPYLVMVPSYTAEDGWTSDVLSLPKASVKTSTPTPTPSATPTPTPGTPVKTGVNNTTGIWVGIAAIAIIVFAVVLHHNKKTSE